MPAIAVPCGPAVGAGLFEGAVRIRRAVRLDGKFVQLLYDHVIRACHGVAVDAACGRERGVVCGVDGIGVAGVLREGHCVLLAHISGCTCLKCDAVHIAAVHVFDLFRQGQQRDAFEKHVGVNGDVVGCGAVVESELVAEDIKRFTVFVGIAEISRSQFDAGGGGGAAVILVDIRIR